MNHNTKRLSLSAVNGVYFTIDINVNVLYGDCQYTHQQLYVLLDAIYNNGNI